ncbi:hypothetical protein B296_00051290 [Ensete ventricosum]|uniref:Uncharacterized protein n=1 Tax=Ensete ventricosum TaxID=4639 RepID=A0A426X765_ENSVE|nr:hypothetical protein B296_00051290 [Ensete ventricosum]
MVAIGCGRGNCSKGVATTKGRRGSGMHGCYRGGRLERETTTGNLCSKGLLLAVSKADGSERSLLAALCRWQQKIAMVAFVLQEITASYNQGGWQREITTGSIVQQEITAGRDQIVAGHDQGRWQQEITASNIGWPMLSPCIESMHLGTRHECVGSSPRVLGVCQDGVREFAKRRPRLAGSLSGVAEKLVGSRDGLVMDILIQLDIGPSSDDVVGSRRKFTRRFAEGIGKLAGNAKGDCRKEDRRTCRKITRGCRSM